MKPTTVALVIRCPELSDGAKVTMMELLFHFENGKFPSLNELKRARSTARSTVQKHVEELIEAGVLKKISAPDGSCYKVKTKKLLELNGLSDEKQIMAWLHCFEIPGSKTIVAAIKSPDSWKPYDATNYFEMLGKRKNSEYVFPKNKKAQAYAQFNRMCLELGWDKVREAIKYFFHNHKRMALRYSVENLFNNRGRIYEQM